MEQYELSCIIPLYKGKEYIVSCVNEILKINIHKEIIIVDDGSPDDSFDFCRSNFADTKEVRIVTKENGGIDSARNHGLDICSGKYVIFVDQDDKVVPSTIEYAVQLLRQNDCDVYFWSTNFFNDSGLYKECDIVTHDIIVNSDSIDDLLRNFLMHRPSCYINYLGHVWAGIYKRENIENHNIRFYKYVDYEDDYLFILNYLNLSNKVGFISKVGYLWRENLKSYSRTYRTINNYICKMELLYDDIKNKNRFIRMSSDDKLNIENYWRQYIVLSAIRNCTNQGYINELELINLKNKIDSVYYKEAFNSLCLVKDKRERLLFYFIKYDLIMAAIYCVCLYFKTKK